MNDNASSAAIAARIRGIIAGQDDGLVDATARRLGVSEVALRMSIDALAPHPAFDVLVAIVQHYGVDPSWLVSGEYDPATHRSALDDEVRLTRAELAKLMTKKLTPAAGSDTVGPTLRLEA